jgi:hypothetical protein
MKNSTKTWNISADMSSNLSQILEIILKHWEFKHVY